MHDLGHRPDPLVGRTLGGKYVVERRLGMGGFGAVYRARQIPVNRAVAVKVAHLAQLDGLGPARDRFLREATALGRLRSRAVAMLFDYGEEPDGLLYMVQEFVDGQTLSEVLRAEGRLPPLRVVDLGLAVLEALDEAGQLELVHRDVKPANIMITRNQKGLEQVKLVDFGLAKDARPRPPGADPEEITGRDAIPGTPTYMAPEVWRQEPLTTAVDQYALAVVLYRALSGRLPFDEATIPGLMRQHLEVPPAPLALSLGVPRPLEAVLRRALAKDPAERFPDPASMARALRAALPDETVPLLDLDRTALDLLLDNTTRRDLATPRLPSVMLDSVIAAPDQPLEPPTQAVAITPQTRPRRRLTALWIVMAISALFGALLALALTREEPAPAEGRARPALPQVDAIEAVTAEPKD